MNLDFDETQLMLRTQAREFITQKCPMTLIRELALDEKGHSEEVWKGMAELGWMSIPFPEKYGGADMSFFELLLIIQEMGRGAVLSPFVYTMLCGLAINEFGTEEQKQEYLPKITGGEITFTLAWTEPNASLEPEGVTLKATKGAGPKYALTGTKLFVPYAHVVDNFLVVARTSDDKKAKGITVFITPAQDQAIICKPQDSIGFDRLAEVEFVNMIAGEKDIVGKLDQGWPVVQKLMIWGAMGMCAEMIGASEKALEMSIDYSKERVQYGKHIGSFQKQQHRLADMWIDLEGSKNYFYEAGWYVSHNERTSEALYASSAKAMVSEIAENLLDQAMLLHGAIGLSWDYDLGFLFRRVRAAVLQFGDGLYHREKMMQVLEK